MTAHSQTPCGPSTKQRSGKLLAWHGYCSCPALSHCILWTHLQEAILSSLHSNSEELFVLPSFFSTHSSCKPHLLHPSFPPNTFPRVSVIPFTSRNKCPFSVYVSSTVLRLSLWVSWRAEQQSTAPALCICPHINQSSPEVPAMSPQALRLAQLQGPTSDVIMPITLQSNVAGWF